MMHMAEIVSGEPDREAWASWLDETRVLRDRHGLVDAELFERVEDIRDATYAYISVRGWTHEEDFQEAMALGALDHGFSGRAVERIVIRMRTQLGDLAPTGPGHVWLVNPFEIAGAEIEGALAMWDRAKDHMLAHPGFMNARLFRARSPAAKHGLLNVSQWRDAASFKQALADRAYDRHRERSLSYKLHPSLCRRVFDLGEASAAPVPVPSVPAESVVA
ncbi:antibiotic biosynthesis monooxygenase family protein [Roseospira visakhapatnamensis]|uniref:Heme-degrading monooxygenase HmoA n=1 Tax=Roseospira visakhapatnamensis TaxID=390880 RepID=A0A7W6RDI7_9PROT|nr:antibiotic biosynthesis monooxygenase [Roseospira visakhapatnamensis]MBB4266513.1 heme-degrading monooxygenase HmoA [Roseospira visakhapatnamensis]